MFNVKFNGQDLTVCSHGIGGPGAAICFEELIKLGAKTIIRLGTCGSLQPGKISKDISLYLLEHAEKTATPHGWFLQASQRSLILVFLWPFLTKPKRLDILSTWVLILRVVISTLGQQWQEPCK